MLNPNNHTETMDVHTQDETLRGYDLLPAQSSVVRTLGDTATFAAITEDRDGAKIVPGTE